MLVGLLRGGWGLRGGEVCLDEAAELCRPVIWLSFGAAGGLRVCVIGSAGALGMARG